MKKKFVSSWNSSKQPRKQRKYRYNAPLHIKNKFVSVHLVKELRDKYNKRNITIKKGDTAKILRGQFKGKTGKIERVDLKETKVFIAGIENIKKDGTKSLYPFQPSNLIITDLDMNDKKRVESLERK